MKSHSGPLRCATNDSDCSRAWVTALMICPVAYGIRMPQVELMVSRTSINTYHQRYWTMKCVTNRKGVAGSGGAAGARCRGTSIGSDRTRGSMQRLETVLLEDLGGRLGT